MNGTREGHTDSSLLQPLADRVRSHSKDDSYRQRRAHQTQRPATPPPYVNQTECHPALCSAFQCKRPCPQVMQDAAPRISVRLVYVFHNTDHQCPVPRQNVAQLEPIWNQLRSKQPFFPVRLAESNVTMLHPTQNSLPGVFADHSRKPNSITSLPLCRMPCCANTRARARDQPR
jgi:hypothetical protein